MTSSFAGEGTTSVPGARALTLEGRRPASRCALSCLAIMEEPPQSVEMDRLDEEVLAAAAAMSIVWLDEEALALGAALERLGAMAYLQSELRTGKEICGKKKKFEGEKASEGFWSLPLTIYKGGNPRKLRPRPMVNYE